MYILVSVQPYFLSPCLQHSKAFKLSPVLSIGMNVDTARLLLRESGLPIIPAENFGDAAREVVASLQ